MSGPWLEDGPADAPLTVLFAHGAGAPMDSPFMAFVAVAMAAQGLRVVRFEFSYMAGRRETGKKRPPDRQPVLLESWRTAVAAQEGRRVALAGKSMGGRMASLVADEVGAAGLACFGYPFHPPGKPEKLRTEHLAGLRTPTIMLQGERDPFGTSEEVPGYTLSKAIRLHWCPDGNHDLAPRKASGRTKEQNWQEAADAAAAFLLGCGEGSRT